MSSIGPNTLPAKAPFWPRHLPQIQSQSHYAHQQSSEQAMSVHVHMLLKNWTLKNKESVKRRNYGSKRIQHNVISFHNKNRWPK